MQQPLFLFFFLQKLFLPTAHQPLKDCNFARNHGKSIQGTGDKSPLIRWFIAWNILPTAVYNQRQTQPQQPPIPPGKGCTKYSREIPRQNPRTSRTQRKLITPIKKASFRLLMAATILRAYRHGFQPQSILPTHISTLTYSLNLFPQLWQTQ